MLVELVNTPRPYDWGDHSAIALWQGRPPAGGPEAELWFGTHPGSPADAITSAGATPSALGSWLASMGYPEALPYLVKLLSAAKPLSIQVHPSYDQAELGFARENAEGISLDAPTRNYRDASAKPEILIAWSERFLALVGFQSAEEIGASLDYIDRATEDPQLTQFLRVALSLSASDAIDLILSDSHHVAELAAAITRAAQAAPPPETAQQGFTLWDLWPKMVPHFPHDPGIVVASFLNRLCLDQGQALFVPAGVVHAYVEGFGLEVMAPSDNVLRGGLTTKHIDRGELAAIVLAEPSSSDVFQPTLAGPGVAHFEPPGVSFRVTRVESASDQHALEGPGPWVVVVESGTGVVNDGGELRPVRAGAAYALVAADGDGNNAGPTLESTGTAYVIGPR